MGSHRVLDGFLRAEPPGSRPFAGQGVGTAVRLDRGEQPLFAGDGPECPARETRKWRDIQHIDAITGREAGECGL